ncbi:MAG: chorismate synthase [bacterium]
MNSFGKLFKVSIYGESHGEAVGVLIDNVKPGISLSISDFDNDLKRRQGGQLNTTSRKETDTPNILSGLFDGKTTGAPMLINFNNENTNSKDYSNLVNHPRPSHADLTFKNKYGNNDYRGGGHSSGRLTVGIVAAGVIAKKMVPFTVKSEIVQIGIEKNKENFEEYISNIKKDEDSVGAIVEITISNIENAIGEPFFYSVESAISQILFSIGGVKGVEFGVGFSGVEKLGSEFNDVIINEFGKTKTNNNGGINGGIANGNDIIIRVFVKPTPSISKGQNTYNFETKKIEELNIVGRHDPCIAKRAMVVLENACMIALCDLFLLNGGK